MNQTTSWIKRTLSDKWHGRIDGPSQADFPGKYLKSAAPHARAPRRSIHRAAYAVGLLRARSQPALTVPVLWPLFLSCWLYFQT